jgi:tetratricopeptide (TPR) repeat protein
MSFQGDVGGIGLADLLQSLARGRDGILTLNGQDGLKSTLGIQDGLLHLLPDPDEDPEFWRNRVRQSWVKDPDYRIDSLRMTEIARAQRIENVYRLLDSEGVHFRFAPGPLPERPTDSPISASEPGVARAGPRRDAVFCAGMPVEGMLLEYARLKDESLSAGVDGEMNDDLVLCVLDGAAVPEEQVRFYNECDGQSSLVEIADRLGWPIRQLRAVAFTELRRGSLRFALAPELLSLALNEIVQQQFVRASARLGAWCDASPPGPMNPGEPEAFDEEWQAGRLQGALASMPKRRVRSLLRRLDVSQANALAAVDRWQEVVRTHGDDPIARLRLMIAQLRAGADPNAPTLKELLSAARGFLEKDRILRAAAILRVAAPRVPEATSARLEFGMCMLSAGLASEAGPWLIEASRTLLEDGLCEKAIPPLRELVQVDPKNREARRLLSRARAQAVRRTLVRKNSLVTLAVIVALSVGAFVQVRAKRDYESRMTEVTAHLSDPTEALRLLDLHFPGDKSPAVASLRNSILERKRGEDTALRTAWTDRYREAQLECTLGDPLLGLQRAFDLPAHPAEDDEQGTWPLVSDLFNGLAARLENNLREIGSEVNDSQQQLHGEERQQKLIADLSALAAKHTDDSGAKDLLRRLQDFEKRLHDRQEARAQARAEHTKQDSLAQQDLLLAAARAHAKAGDYPHAIAKYQQLIASDPTGKLKDLLAKEIRAADDKNSALIQARKLCTEGKHTEAKKLLEERLDSMMRMYLMPWRVETFPPGAHARLKDGSVHVTPFTVQSSFGETIEMSLDLEGYDPQTLTAEDPKDYFLYFSRTPERWWKTDGRIEALPVASGEDHIVTDRSGHLARMAKGETPVWQHKLSSLGGIARAPVFLPRRPGFLLLVTEDGEAWVIEAASGAMEGPYAMGSPPIDGPYATESGVRALFRDGRTAEWESRLKPETITNGDVDTAAGRHTGSEGDARHGSASGLAVLRRRTDGGSHLDSPWSKWSIDIEKEVYSIHLDRAKEPAFTVRRSGEWTYVAWEAPHTLIPRGRLWIADGQGLRSFQP